MTDLKRLRELAMGALPSPWTYPSEWNGGYSFDGAMMDATGNLRPVLVMTVNSNFEWAKPTAAFIAAANPQTLLSLIDRIERLEGALRVLECDTFSVTIGGRTVQKEHSPRCRRCEALGDE